MSDTDQKSETSSTQFLDIKSYRQKRLKDAAMLLPLLGGLLFLFPLVYLFIAYDTPGSPGATAIYLFSAWLILILCAAYLAPRMQAGKNND